MSLRKTLDDDYVQRKIVAELRRQPFVKPACYAAGIHPQRFFEWRRRWLADDPDADQFHEFFTLCAMAQGQLECDWVADIAEKTKGTRGKQWVLQKYKRGVYGASGPVGIDNMPIPPKAIEEMSETEVKAYIFLLQTWLQKKLDGREQLRGGALPAPQHGTPAGDEIDE